MAQPLLDQLQIALNARDDMLDMGHTQAIRLINGFYEGMTGLIAEIYARTLVLMDLRDASNHIDELLPSLQTRFLERYPWIDCVIQKRRIAPDYQLRRGVITYGSTPATKVNENQIWYALDLRLNQDSSFYLDTRYLRRWLFEHAAGWEVINFFAYTGSLGIAALAGGASHVEQVDRNARFLALAQKSASLNHLDFGCMSLQKADFFSRVAFHKKTKKLFDCVILDPPYFSTTKKGRISQGDQAIRVINKARPLVKNGGNLILINNALFLSGQDYFRAIESLCEDGYMAIEDLVTIPSDVTGFVQSTINSPPKDPAPFNHSTKIVILRVRRKQT